jgi:uncharacterized protein
VLEVLATFRPAAVYLFGSFGTPAQRPDSDVDLAFLPDAPVDALRVFDASNDLANVLWREVDLVDLSAASTVLAKEVIRTGAILESADDGRRAEFEMRALSDYARLNEERRPVMAASGG